MRVIETVVVLPSPPALLKGWSSSDPVAELRAACLAAVAGLRSTHRFVVLATPVTDGNVGRGISEPLGHRVARSLLGELVFEAQLALPYTAAALIEVVDPVTLVVMADGSARRGEKAPGHLHAGAVPFDESIETALRTGDAESLAGIDPELATELWCEGAPGLRILGEIARGRVVAAEVSYAGAPYGVAWWVARWELRTSEEAGRTPKVDR